MNVAAVVPVYANAPTLPELAARLAVALGDHQWRLRLVVDASPDTSLAVAERLASAHPRVSVTSLTTNVGQHRALARGLAAEGRADAWVCLDADLQDPPEAVPVLLERLARGDVGAVFAGRRGAYESPGRLLTGALHRAVLARLAGLPPDAGAFVAMNRLARDAVVALAAPSVVVAIGASGVRTVAVPVERAVRPSGRSAWTARARLGQSARSLVWAASHRCTRTSA
jgi:glycosyltransferase involved in cell wall biosynthesis